MRGAETDWMLKKKFAFLFVVVAVAVVVVVVVVGLLLFYSILCVFCVQTVAAKKQK